jgi:hypothetical protein
MFINFSRALASFPESQLPRIITYNSSGVNTGKDADLENWQFLLTFPESRIFSRNQLPSNETSPNNWVTKTINNNSRELNTGKDARLGSWQRLLTIP